MAQPTTRIRELPDLAPLCRKYAVEELKVFGSFLRDDYSPTSSDIDLLVRFNAPPQGMRLATQFFGFKDELQGQLGRRIDLLEESAINNSVLRRSIVADAVKIYGPGN